MTRLESVPPFGDLNTALAQITADFGTWRVLSALLRQLFIRKRRVTMLAPPLDAHMRRDVGLPPLSDRPPVPLPMRF